MRMIIFFLLFWTQLTFAAPVEIDLNNYPFVGPYQATLSSEAFFTQREKFDEKGKELDIRLFKDRPELPFKIWKQPEPAPAVFLIPGFAGHYRGNTTLGLASLLYQNGFTVVACANPMNFDFSRPALTANLPGYTPEDTKDLHRALAAMVKVINVKYPNQFLGYAVAGYSSGALYTLFLADLETKLPANEKIGFQTYVAINPPVSADYSMDRIDEAYRIYQNWTDEQRKANYVNFITRISALEISQNERDQIRLIKSLPQETLQVAIGAAFRLKLSALLTVAMSDGQLQPLFAKGYLKDLEGTYSSWSRKRFYKIIEEKYNFHRYIHEAVIPYYQIRDVNVDAQTLLHNTSLYAIADELRTNPNISVLHNKDDVFMHDAEKLKWLENTLGDKLVLFDRGGHVGNLYMPQVQDQIVRSLRQSFQINQAPVISSSLYNIRFP
jgi:predicted alpha/beta-fold hydrolase